MDEELEVLADDTAAETHQEETAQDADDVKEEQTDTAVDEKGVPLKNREAEATRKARKAERMSQSDAQEALLGADVARQGDPGNQEEAISIVRAIASEQLDKRLEPLLAKQFLMENPDARDMIDDINRVRSKYPELAGVDKLEVALKIAKAERQDEIIRKKVEAERRKDQETLEKSNQASLEGAGRATTGSSGQTLEDQIANAGSLEDLRAIEESIQK